MTTALHIANAIGRKELATALRVGETAVSNAVVRGWFPSSWFLVVKPLALAKNVECPPELFRMRIPNTPNVDDGAGRQGNMSERTGG